MDDPKAAAQKDDKALTSSKKRYRTLAVIDDSEDLSSIHTPACRCGSNLVRRRKHEDAVRLYRAKKQAREQGVIGAIFVRSEDLDAKMEDLDRPLPYNHPDGTPYTGNAFRERLAELSNDGSDYAELLDDAIRNPVKWRARTAEWAGLLKFAIETGFLQLPKLIENESNKNSNRTPIHFHVGLGPQPSEIEIKRVNSTDYEGDDENDEDEIE
jgi:hypothetical protein